MTPGSSNDQNAFRSELAGIYAITVIHWAMCKYYQSATGQMEIACDGKSALLQAQWSEDFVNPNIPHYDIILAIRSVRKLTNWKWTWRHVKGHQDSRGGEIDFWAGMNIHMDSLAKEHWNNCHDQLVQDHQIWGEPWQIWLGSEKVVSTLGTRLTQFCTSQQAAEYWKGKPRIGSNFAAVDWQAIGGAIRSLPLSHRIWITKHVTGFAATGVNMFRRKARPSAQCPRCSFEEDSEHVLKCCGQDSDAVWEKSLKKMKEWLLESTHPGISESIINYLNGWRNDTQPTLHPSMWFYSAFTGQNVIGWRNFLEGFICNEWQLTQQNYFLRVGSRRSPRRWTAALIRKLWEVAWDMWEHRNGILHNKEQSIILNHLHAQIREEFQRGSTDLSRDAQALFRPGLAGILSKPVEVKQQWLARIQLAREKAASYLSLGSAFQQERRGLAQWLGRTAT